MSTYTAEPAKDLFGHLEFYLVEKAPVQLPPGAKEWIVRYGPWITLALIILAIPAVLLALGLGAVMLPFGGARFAAGFSYLTVMLIVTLGMRAAALPGLFARRMSGWTMLFYAQIVSFVFSILSGSIVGGVVGLVLSMYVLFQVRPLYRP